MFNILEVLDRLFSSSGQDIHTSLHKAVLVFGAPGPDGEDRSRSFVSRVCSQLVRAPHKALQIAVLMFFLVVQSVLHSLVLFVQIVCLNVAINSQTNTILALLISNNFTELKSAVFKRFNTLAHFQLSCSDAVEIFQLGLFLTLIALEDGLNVNDAAFNACLVFAVELLVDSFKH